MPYNIFAIPYAGGSSMAYTSISQLLPKEIEFQTLELPGRGLRTGEDLVDDLNLLAKDVYLQINTSNATSKYVLYGHSMGGLLAYLTANVIRRKGLKSIKHIVITGCAAPSFRDTPRLSALPNHELIEEIFMLDGTSDDLKNEPQLWDFFLPIFRSDFKAFEEYVHKEEYPLNIPLTIVTGFDEVLNEKHLSGWKNITTSQVSFLKMPGGHFFIHDNAQELAKLLTKTLLSKEQSIFHSL